MAETAIIVAE